MNETSTVICPRCSKPGFSWGRNRCMYCGHENLALGPLFPSPRSTFDDTLYSEVIRQCRAARSTDPTSVQVEGVHPHA